ncbi:adenylate cyclase [Solibacillus sp. FSL R5-0691]|uniref:adenylate cyclase n=1 Tax=unclassified Solibacillus TaxID=2637870 RepID=UPI0030CD18F3
MKKIWMFAAILFILYGCTEKKEEPTVESESAMLEVSIPTEVARHYGSLNIEYKASDVYKSIEPNGVVSLAMNEQQLTEVTQQTEQFLKQYKKTSEQSTEDGITHIAANENYSNWEIVLSDDSLIEQEAFDLAQEHLIKNILTYQLVHRQNPELNIQYVTDDGEPLDRKIIRTKFAYSDE